MWVCWNHMTGGGATVRWSGDRHQAVPGYWHTPSTLHAYLRIRSYLVSARGHGIHPMNAIHRALTGTPWLPTPA